ncbi:FtsW/RodA/SpoVE family cell cycle protein [Micropruina sp. KQZ13P-5]|nr:FtsW/RodA/SpoVE family cell cycle protein [Micropruina sp. KQZ13P-5]MCW3159026.1 FtsW/RodA/SpoVE family cell cycle protein [Micropruina sp. KQZ13P-5]
MGEVVVFRKRRGVELVMLIMGMGLAVAGYALVSLNVDGELPGDFYWGVGLYVAIGLAAHVVIRLRAPYADPLLFPLVYTLNGFGLAMIYRLDLGGSKRMHSAELQLTWTAISVAVFIAVLFLLKDHRKLQRFPYLMFLAGMAILMMPLLPVIGFENHGARIWIKLGPYSFQPAELAKIVLTVAFASYLVEKKDVLALAGARFLGIDLPRPRDLGPIIVMWLSSLAVLIFQKDLGTSLLFFGLFVMMLYVATERPSWPILGTLLFLGGAFVGWLTYGHVQTRVSAWLNPFANWDQNYQIIQGQFGMAWGGLFGTGWGLGRPNLTPLAKNDFIAAALGEELGVAGLMAIIVIYGVIVMRGLRTALTAREPFSKLLAAGLSFVFALQVFAIIGGVTRLLPLTGLTTPFVSQGGSSLVANYAMIALLLVVTHRVRRPRTAAEEPQQSLAHDTTQVIAVPSRAAQPRPEPTFGDTPLSADDPLPDQQDAEPTAAIPAPGGADEPTTALPTGTGAGAGAGADEPTTALPTGADPNEPTTALPTRSAPGDDRPLWRQP